MGMDHRINMNGGIGLCVESRPILMHHFGSCVDEGKLLAHRALKHYRMRIKCALLELTN